MFLYALRVLLRPWVIFLYYKVVKPVQGLIDTGRRKICMNIEYVQCFPLGQLTSLLHLLRAILLTFGYSFREKTKEILR